MPTRFLSANIPAKKYMEKTRIITSLITTGSYDDMVNGIFSLAQDQPSSYVCCANVHMVVEAYKDRSFNEILNNADMATPDGAPLTKSMQLLYGIKQERVAGMDLLPSLLREAEKRNQSVYFFGDTMEVLSALRDKIALDFPRLRVAGIYSPPFKQLTRTEEQDIVSMINAMSPDLLFVALGCPKQEKWMAAHKGKVNACMLGVGNAFRTYIGVLDRAPGWMQKLSLEWLYRLIQEPQRLWKRYLVTNSLFLFLLGKSIVTNTR